MKMRSHVSLNLRPAKIPISGRESFPLPLTPSLASTFDSAAALHFTCLIWSLEHWSVERRTKFAMASSALPQTTRDVSEEGSPPSHTATDISEEAASPSQPDTVAEITGSRLLQLPPELRNMIWEYAVVDSRIITIDTNGLQEPSLLTTSKEIRQEAVTIFYSENRFELVSNDYDPTNFLKWERIVIAAIKRGDIPGFDTGRATAAVTSLDPNWTNLLTWMEMPHNGRTALHVCEPGLLEHYQLDIVVVGGMFVTVKKMQSQAWDVVSKLINRREFAGR